MQANDLSGMRLQLQHIKEAKEGLCKFLSDFDSELRRQEARAAIAQAWQRERRDVGELSAAFEKGQEAGLATADLQEIFHVFTSLQALEATKAAVRVEMPKDDAHIDALTECISKGRDAGLTAQELQVAEAILEDSSLLVARRRLAENIEKASTVSPKEATAILQKALEQGRSAGLADADLAIACTLLAEAERHITNARTVLSAATVPAGQRVRHDKARQKLADAHAVTTSCIRACPSTTKHGADVVICDDDLELVAVRHELAEKRVAPFLPTETETETAEKYDEEGDDEEDKEDEEEGTRAKQPPPTKPPAIEPRRRQSQSPDISSLEPPWRLGREPPSSKDAPKSGHADYNRPRSRTRTPRVGLKLLRSREVSSRGSRPASEEARGSTSRSHSGIGLGTGSGQQTSAAASQETHLEPDAFNWVKWRSHWTLFVNVDKVPSDLIQGGIKAGQQVYQTFTKSVAEAEGHWIDAASASTSLPEGTLCFTAPLKFSKVTICAAAWGGNKHKTRPRALGLALAVAAEALGGAAVLAHWKTRQKDLGHGHFDTLVAHVLEKWAACAV
eukprot:TRINITY_DN88390_c0_g1_i1.p1 TRINITY_DN88390_c0_g1~~TRINITY_DN88390_c0_g1_i1.p1  ORF type:complete len:633 (-),score=151.69 TRINITY_DN88390_c0_g1_i1:180-1868(-)